MGPKPPDVSHVPIGPARTIADMSEAMREFILRADNEPTSPRSGVRSSLGSPSSSVLSSDTEGEGDEREESKDEGQNLASLTSPSPPTRVASEPSFTLASTPPTPVTKQKPAPILTTSGSAPEISSSERYHHLRRPSINRTWLSPDEQFRYDFFSHQRTFVQSITNICESLRMVDLSSRKCALRTKLEALVIPPQGFLPLCKSTDVFQRVIRPCVEEGHVFTTNVSLMKIVFQGGFRYSCNIPYRNACRV